MSFLNPKPEPFRRGQDGLLSAKTMNEIVRAVVRQIRGGGDTSVGYFGDRLTVASDFNIGYLPQLANYFMQWQVVQEDTDLLLCVPFQQPLTEEEDDWDIEPYNGDFVPPETDTPFYVAKPYQLQQTPWNGKEVSLNGLDIVLNYTGIGKRTATMVDMTVSEGQVIVPDYMSGDIILAIRLPSGYDDPNLKVPVAWMDVNVAGRAWAVQTSIGGSSGVPSQLDALGGVTGLLGP